MNPPKLDHIGIAVEDLDRALVLYRTLGFAPGPVEELPAQGVRLSFLPLGAERTGGTRKHEGEGRVELIAALGPDTPVGRFLAKKGPGFHHLCFAVPDLRSELARLAAAGVELIDKEPRMGAHGAEVAFLHPKSTGGVLIELTEED